MKCAYEVYKLSRLVCAVALLTIVVTQSKTGIQGHPIRSCSFGFLGDDRIWKCFKLLLNVDSGFLFLGEVTFTEDVFFASDVDVTGLVNEVNVTFLEEDAVYKDMNEGKTMYLKCSV